MTLGFEERLALRKQVSQAKQDHARRRLFLLDWCQHCHEEFDRRRTHQAFCSAECRKAAWKREMTGDGLRAPAPLGAYIDARGAVIRTHSRAGYMRGCRCDTCRAAHTSYMRAWKSSRVAA